MCYHLFYFLYFVFYHVDRMDSFCVFGRLEVCSEGANDISISLLSKCYSRMISGQITSAGVHGAEFPFLHSRPFARKRTLPVMIWVNFSAQVNLCAFLVKKRLWWQKKICRTQHNIAGTR